MSYWLWLFKSFVIFFTISRKNARIIAEIGYYPFLLILSQFFVSLRAGWSEDRIPEEVNCLHLSSPALGSIQPRIQWYRLIRWGKVAGVWRWSSTEVKGRVEIYMYCRSVHSWKVIAPNVPFHFITQVSRCDAWRYCFVRGGTGFDSWSNILNNAFRFCLQCCRQMDGSDSNMVRNLSPLSNSKMYNLCSC